MCARSVLLIICAPTSLAESIETTRLVYTVVPNEREPRTSATYFHNGALYNAWLQLVRYLRIPPSGISFVQDIHRFLALCSGCTTRNRALITGHLSLNAWIISHHLCRVVPSGRLIWSPTSTVLISGCADVRTPCSP